MKLAVALLALASAATAQIAARSAITPTTPPSKATAEKVRIGPQTFRDLERQFDSRISTIDRAVPFDLLGGARGLYLDGYGVVFTAELSLIQNPVASPFRPPLSAKEIADVRKQKLDHLPKLQQAMTEMMATFAAALSSLPADQKIVLAVRLLYQPWEQTADLPAQIMMTADRNSAGLGSVRMEQQ